MRYGKVYLFKGKRYSFPSMDELLRHIGLTNSQKNRAMIARIKPMQKIKAGGK